MSDILTEYQKEQAKERLEQWRKSTMTVKELYDKLGELIASGDGDAMISVDDNCGGSYSLSKTTNIFVSHTKEELNGKWCFFDTI